jgi:hypothetical protein
LEKIVKADVELVIDLLKYLGETDFHWYVYWFLPI